MINLIHTDFKITRYESREGKIIKTIINFFIKTEGVYQKSYDRVCLILRVSTLFIILSVINLNISNNSITDFFFHTLIALAFTNPFIYKFVKNYLLAMNLIIVLFLFDVTYLIVNTNGLFSPFLFWYIGPIVLVAILLRTKSIIVWSLTTILIFNYLLYQNIFSRTDILIQDQDVLISLYKQSFANIFVFTSSCLIFYSMKVRNRLRWLNDGNIKIGSLIQILSHDIINPLNLILGFTQVLQEERKDNEYTNGILRAADQIQKIIYHVKEMQALESGKRELGLSAMDIGKPMENVKFLFKERAKKKGISLIIRNEVEDSVKVMAEPVSFSHQVLNNLVSNAIKFTPEFGEIIVHTYRKSNKIHINIQDTGIGIPQKLIPNLFRFDVATSRLGTEGERGTGFGLPLVKKYIELYHGDIYVESIESSNGDDSDVHGTSFHIILNCA
mgnify:CR=1 FL=1